MIQESYCETNYINQIALN